MNFMHTPKPSKPVFMSEDEINEQLTRMESDSSIKSSPSIVQTAPGEAKMKSFTEIHTDYLKKHPKINPEYYLANLRTVLRIRH